MTRSVSLLAVFFLAPLCSAAAPLLKVSENRRFLVYEDERPFFYLGDTAWELFHRLNREEVDRYLEDRARKGFTVIQAVALAELDGLRDPNAYGHRPLIENDPTRPDVKDGPANDYWDHVDYIVEKAGSLGLFIGLLPTWGDKWNKGNGGAGPSVFNPQNAGEYGEWIGKRYAEKGIIWILGGDRAVENDGHKETLRAMARGLKKGDGGRHLMTFHPPGGATSSRWFHDDDWLSFNMHQTGHRLEVAIWDGIAADYLRQPTKPVLDGEPLYEDHPIAFDPVKNGFSVDWQIRRLAYWDVFAGAAGHTYGCHNIWQMVAPGRKPISWAHRWWHESLDLWGAGDMKHLKNLMLSRPYLTRIPDQSIILVGAGAYEDHTQATRDSEGSYAFVYIPIGGKVTVSLEKLSGSTVRASWYDPRHGTAQDAGTFEKKGPREFEPPIAGKGNDWILVLDDAAKNFAAPGSVK